MEEDEILQTVLKDVNALKCTNFNLVDVGDTYETGRVLPALCENGFTHREINEDIDKLREVFMSEDDEKEHCLVRTPPYCMNKEALARFKEYMTTPFLSSLNDDGLVYSVTDILAALVPHQTGLKAKVISLCLKYNFKEIKNIEKLGEPCEKLICAANYFVMYKGEEGLPPFPKSRRPVVYRLTDDIYNDREKALKYLVSLQDSLTSEKTTQCIVCDVMEFYMSSTKNEKRSKNFDLLCLPDIHESFYKNGSMHIFKKTRGFIFSDLNLKRMADGKYTITYQDRVYD